MKFLRHEGATQLTVNAGSPRQVSPLFEGTGFVHCRPRDVTPPTPHVTLQSVHSDQADHPPQTAETRSRI